MTPEEHTVWYRKERDRGFAIAREHHTATGVGICAEGTLFTVHQNGQAVFMFAEDIEKLASMLEWSRRANQ